MYTSTVEIYVPIMGKTSDGIPKKIWGYTGFNKGYWDDTLTWNDSALWLDGPNETITADVQPAQLNQAQLASYGFNTLPSDTKKIYWLDFSNNLAIGNRVRVDFDKVFDIKGTNVWDTHTEVIASPVIGE